MAKGLFKSNKLVWGLAIVLFVSFLFYVVKRREGFQNNPTVPVGPPTTIPATSTMTNTNTMDVPMPTMNTVDTSMSGATTMPSATTMPGATTMSGATQSGTTVEVVRAKLDELKTLVDSM